MNMCGHVCEVFDENLTGWFNVAIKDHFNNYYKESHKYNAKTQSVYENLTHHVLEFDFL